MSKIWNWAIFGPGNIARTFTKALQGQANANVLAVASKSQERARSFADEFNIPYAYAAYEQALQNPEIDIVYIATLNNSHYPLAKACLEAHKHVLIEKPITLNETELEAIIQLARENNCFVMEAMWTKFRPETIKVREWSQNEIGQLKSIQCSFGFASGLDPKSRIVDINLGASALLDIGVYGISYVNMLFDAKPAVMHYSARTSSEHVDISGAIALSYPDDKVASILLSSADQLDNSALIYGTEGFIRVESFHDPKSASLYKKTAAGEYKLVENYSVPNKINGYEYQAMHVTSCLDQGLTESPVHSLNDSVKIMEIMDQLRKEIGLVYPEEKVAVV